MNPLPLPRTSPLRGTGAMRSLLDRPLRAGTRRRGAFTLMELLMVMVIIAILSSMVLAGLFSAYEAAKQSKTRGTISKIHSQIMHRWESYRTRRLAIAMLPGESANHFAGRRLAGLWELQRIEMPDDYSDLSFTPIVPEHANNALRQAYLARITQFTAQAAENSSAECLYLMVTLGMNADEEVRFLDSEIGDTDEDGIPEFLDGWGRPIHWIRWAPGFIPRLRADTDFQRDDPPGSTAPLTGFQADPFDPRGNCRPGSQGPQTVQLPSTRNMVPLTLWPPPGNPPPTDGEPSYGFKLVPLVYSWGPDGESGIFSALDTARAWHPYAWHSDPGSPPTMRYSDGTTPSTKWRGTPILGLEGGGHVDNFHNHRLGNR